MVYASAECDGDGSTAPTDMKALPCGPPSRGRVRPLPVRPVRQSGAGSRGPQGGGSARLRQRVLVQQDLLMLVRPRRRHRRARGARAADVGLVGDAVEGAAVVEVASGRIGRARVRLLQVPPQLRVQRLLEPLPRVPGFAGWRVGRRLAGWWVGGFAGSRARMPRGGWGSVQATFVAAVADSVYAFSAFRCASTSGLERLRRVRAEGASRRRIRSQRWPERRAPGRAAGFEVPPPGFVAAPVVA